MNDDTRKLLLLRRRRCPTLLFVMVAILYGLLHRLAQSGGGRSVAGEEEIENCAEGIDIRALVGIAQQGFRRGKSVLR